MITVNLLPQEFQKKKTVLPKIPHIPFIIGGVGLFVVITLFFYIQYLQLNSRLGELSKVWEGVQPEYRILTQLQKELEGELRKEKDFLERFVTTSRPLTHELGWASELLPSTAWLAEFRLERSAEDESILLRGFALPSDDKSSIEHIEIYLNQLKEKMAEATLSLTTTRQMIEGFSVTQFTANFIWKSAGSEARR